MKTVVLPSLSRNADWPYHSTCMTLLETSRRQAAGDGDDLVGGAPAAHRRRRGGDQARHDREGERVVQAVAERLRDQIREERVPGEHHSVVGADACERLRAD